ncbi:MAG: hypothetical protein E6K85_09675 [Thaumarchaeota archaeon]|nr:MAG: hypothetical protein E6K85_09675 [Nitrososphaerota archaeon]
MSNYLNRFLNVPAVAIPTYTEGNIDSVKNQGAENIMDEFLDALDKHQQVNEAAKIVASHLVTGGDEVILPILVHSLLREDRSFHTIQMLEAALTQKSEAKRLRLFDDDNRASAVLIAAARYLAAHSPTARSQGQTFDIAWRLNQGGKLYEEIS